MTYIILSILVCAPLVPLGSFLKESLPWGPGPWFCLMNNLEPWVETPWELFAFIICSALSQNSHSLRMTSEVGNFAYLGGIQGRTAGNEPFYEVITGLSNPSNRLCPTVDSHHFGRLRLYWVINKDRNFLGALYSLLRAPRFFTVALWGRQLYAPQISEEVRRTHLASGTALVEVTRDLSMPKAKAAPRSTQQCLAKGTSPSSPTRTPGTHCLFISSTSFWPLLLGLLCRPLHYLLSTVSNFGPVFFMFCPLFHSQLA